MLLPLLTQNLGMGTEAVHARTRIRNAIVDLCTGLDTTGANVFETRVYPLADSSLPAISVYTDQDEMTEMLGTVKELRESTIRLELSVKATTGYEDTLDTIRAEVETALGADSTLGIGVEYSHFDSVDIELGDDEEQPIAQANMIWRVVYTVDKTDVSVIEQ